MKTIDLSKERVGLDDIVKLARTEPVLLKTVGGDQFVVSSTDDFVTEVELLRRNHQFLAFLDERFRSPDRISLAEVEKQANRGD